jgi:hypothetical protein
MSNPTLTSIADMVDDRPTVDNQELFDTLWGITQELYDKVADRFELTNDPSTTDLQPYKALHGEAKGFLRGMSGPEIDWLILSWIGTPGTSFTNMHLTVSLGPHINVPHFGFALGTAPDIFMYMDYVPRTDLLADLDYLDTYYEPVNPSHLKLKADERFSPFVSQNLYMRQAQSHTSHCYIVKPTPETITIVRDLAHEMLNRWLGWVDRAPPVPEADRPALAARDLHVRRAICERDPANSIGTRLFGEEMTNRLVRGLWGGDRELPRPK